MKTIKKGKEIKILEDNIRPKAQPHPELSAVTNESLTRKGDPISAVSVNVKVVCKPSE